VKNKLRAYIARRFLKWRLFIFFQSSEMGKGQVDGDVWLQMYSIDHYRNISVNGIPSERDALTTICCIALLADSIYVIYKIIKI
jgi:hypothetical protein